VEEPEASGVRGGDDLPALILAAAQARGMEIQDSDILVVAQKIVSKAEGRLVPLSSITPSPFAEDYARTYNKDPRHVEVVLRESRRIVRMDRGVLIAEPPNLWLMRDTHGDLRADAKELVSNQFGHRDGDPQNAGNGFPWALDNRMYTAGETNLQLRLKNGTFELQKTLAHDVFQNRLKNFTNRLDDTSTIGKTRRDLARVLTPLREKEAPTDRDATGAKAERAGVEVEEV